MQQSRFLNMPRTMKYNSCIMWRIEYKKYIHLILKFVNKCYFRIASTIFKLIKRTGKFSIIDAYLDLMSTHTIKSFEFADSRFIDVGKPESVEMAEAMFPL